LNLLDVNVLVYAFRADAERHADYRRWLMDVVDGEAAFGVAEQALAGMVRVSTHPKVFREPSRTEDALAFVDALLAHPSCRVVRPTPAHWSLFAALCRRSKAKGNLVSDAWLAALAIESGCTWITTDRDFSRFPGLRWRHPLDDERDTENPE
jgi:uncharacterized protein